MNSRLTGLPKESWGLHEQVVFNVLFEENPQFALFATDKSAAAVLYSAKPLWVYAEEGCNSDVLTALLNECRDKFIKTGLIVPEFAADLCADLFHPKETHSMAAFYLPPHVRYENENALVYPNESDVPMLENWIKCFYMEALGIDYIEADTAKALITGKKLYCLEAGGRLAAMGMIIPLPNNMCRLNLIYVPPEFRKAGCGKAVVSAICADIQARGMLPVLYARCENTAACSLYKSLGFTEAGRLAELIFN